jgi:hypothetical protein
VTASVRFLLLPLLCASLSGCGIISKALTPRHKEDKDKTPKDIAIGQVEIVNPEQHFVLIRTVMQFKLEPGWKLETRPISGPKSVLTITPEQKANFLSADITEGSPQQGELVVLPPQAGLAAAMPTLPGGPASGPQGAPPSSLGSPPSAALPLPPQPQQPPQPHRPLRAPNGDELPPPIP